MALTCYDEYISYVQTRNPTLVFLFSSVNARFIIRNASHYGSVDQKVSEIMYFIIIVSTSHHSAGKT